MQFHVIQALKENLRIRRKRKFLNSEEKDFERKKQGPLVFRKAPDAEIHQIRKHRKQLKTQTIYRRILLLIVALGVFLIFFVGGMLS